MKITEKKCTQEKEIYECPISEVILFGLSDIITASGGEGSWNGNEGEGGNEGEWDWEQN